VVCAGAHPEEPVDLSANGFTSGCRAREQIDQMMRVVVRYVDARPERAHEAFATLAQAASGRVALLPLGFLHVVKAAVNTIFSKL